MSPADSSHCGVCAAPTTIVLGGEPRCDRCADADIATATGWPLLPEPPAPATLVGPDGRRHTLHYRLLRVPSGIEALAEERGTDLAAGQGTDVGGYRFSLVGPHDAEAAALVGRLRQRVHREVRRLYLERADDGADWQVAADELAGRVEEDPDDCDGPPRVIVDGRALTWEEVGRLLRPFVGWEFRLRFGDEVVDTGEP